MEREQTVSIGCMEGEGKVNGGGGRIHLHQGGMGVNHDGLQLECAATNRLGVIHE